MSMDKMRKAYQRKFNHKIHQLNKNIEMDNLWRGRFVFLQKNCRWWKFEDGSGGELILSIRAYDKKTGYYHDYHLEYAPWMHTFDWNLTMEVGNTFIVEDLDVWRNEERPTLDSAIDYTHVKVDVEKLMSQPWNFYVDAEHFKEWKTKNLQS
jgi:hypothetical protein